MTEKDFILWLHGFFEISNAKTLDETQVSIIKDHLALFFQKVTPNREPSEFIDKDLLKRFQEHLQRYLDEAIKNGSIPVLHPLSSINWTPPLTTGATIISPKTYC